MNRFAGYLLLAPYDFIIVQATDMRYNHEILAIRKCDTIPVISFFHKTARDRLVLRIFVFEIDLVHGCKIVNPSGLVNVFAVENIPQNHVFFNRNFSVLITRKYRLRFRSRYVEHQLELIRNCTAATDLKISSVHAEAPFKNITVLSCDC